MCDLNLYKYIYTYTNLVQKTNKYIFGFKPLAMAQLFNSRII